jgi:uncharacterized protein (DUF488 family)
MHMNLYTIGFTKKSAKEFFSLLINNNVRKLFDIRLKNSSQLAGFTKSVDLEYFLHEIAGIEYEHALDLAPTQEILDDYKRKNDWESYEKCFMALITERKIEERDKSNFVNACLLCSEKKPLKCHRKIVAEYLKNAWGNVDIIHLI